MTVPQSNPTWDNFIKQLIHDLEPWGREQEKRLRPATVLDRDNQELSTGLTILEDDGSRGVFWPQAASPLDTNPGNAAILTVSDGRRFEIQQLWADKCAMTRHFHFHSLLVDPCQMRATPTKQTEAHVIKANGEIGFARFDSIDIGGQIGLVLDRGQAPDKSPAHFFPEPATLTGDPAPGYFAQYGGPPIDVRPYLSLPSGRRGFVLTD